MRIVHLISSLGYGGAEQLLVDYLTTTDRAGHEHIVISLRGGHQAAKLRSFGVTTYVVHGLVARYDLIAFLRVLRLLIHYKPDVMHTWLWSANILGRCAGTLLKIPVVCSLHSSSAPQSRFANWLERKTASLQDAVIAVSRGVRESYWNNVLSKLRSEHRAQEILKRITVVHNGIDVDRLQRITSSPSVARSAYGLNQKHFVVGAIGRLEPIKGFDHVIKAFAHFVLRVREHEGGAPHLRLVIIGDGSQRDALEKLTRQAGLLGHVRFLGAIEDVRTHYTLFDCLAIGSRSEGLSLVLLEALASRVPVVTTHDHTPHDVIEDGVHGLLVSRDRVEHLGDALFELYTNPERAATLVVNGEQRVQYEFCLVSMAREYMRIYDSVVSRSD